MARRKTEHLTPLELEIMHVLWASGPANVLSGLPGLVTRFSSSGDAVGDRSRLRDQRRPSESIAVRWDLRR